jgi:nucleoside-diphosphate-sugar epimerase
VIVPNRGSDRQVLVVGGAGYVGSALSRRLLEAGHRVRVLDALIYANGSSLAGLADRERFEFVKGDMRSPEEVRVSLEGVTDVVLLAALVGDPVCKRNPDTAREINLGGAQNVLDASAAAGVERCVFASTCSNYGLRETDTPATEEDELHPLSLYAETKVEMEGRILRKAPEMDMSATILRVATAFGMSQRMRFDLTVSEFTRELTLGRQLDVYDADTWRPYCHVEDISTAILTVLSQEPEIVAGEVFNAGGDEGNYTKRMLVEAALEALGGEGEVNWVEGGVDARNYRVSFAKIRERLGFTPAHSVPGAIANLVGALRSGVFDDVESRLGFYSNHNLIAGLREVGVGSGDAG